MKKWSLFLSLYLCAWLLAACADKPPVEEEPPSTEPGTATMICRVVDEEDGTLLLAKQDGGNGDVYTVTVENQDIEEGALVEVAYNGVILETYPAQLGGDAAVTVLENGFDDRCTLYLDVLEDLWEVDSGLNSDDGMTYLGVDLSATSLSKSEQSTLAWAFAGEHDLDPLQGTWDELVEQGYIDKDNLVWEDGCLFSITETESSEKSVTFDAQKWRSGLGAYYFCDCTASRSVNGHWGDYTVGSEVIS